MKLYINFTDQLFFDQYKILLNFAKSPTYKYFLILLDFTQILLCSFKCRLKRIFHHFISHEKNLEIAFFEYIHVFGRNL